MEEVLASILQAGEEHRRRVSTATLNLVLKEATAWKAPPTQRNTMRKGKIYYCTQVCGPLRDAVTGVYIGTRRHAENIGASSSV